METPNEDAAARSASAASLAVNNKNQRRLPELAEEKLYKAEYLGSGTFAISKPKRTRRKIRQSKLKNPQRGSRK
jgi:hypothetical protein